MSVLVFLIEQLAIGIYIFIAIGIIWHVRRFFIFHDDYRSAQFELERDIAGFQRANALTVVILLVQFGVIVAGVQTVVAPEVRQRIDTTTVLSQTVEDLVFNTPTPAPLAQLNIDTSNIDFDVTNPADVIRITPTPTDVPPGTIEPNAPAAIGCDTPFATLRVPANGMVVHQVIEVIGTAYTENFSKYKLEISGPQTNGQYATIEQLIQPVEESGRLSQFVPLGYREGWYLFRVAVFDQLDRLRASCAVNIYIRPPIPTETPIPMN